MAEAKVQLHHFIVPRKYLMLVRYHEVFFMIDTCQAASMYERFYSPNILAVGSSMVGEDSLSVSTYAKQSIYLTIQNTSAPC